MGFNVRIEPSGHEFAVDHGETILGGALRAGYILPYSCRNGACGSCKGRLLAGVIDYGGYEAAALSEDEKRAGKALFCQSVPRSNVVIEAKEIDVARDILIKTMPCRVDKMEQVAHDVMILSLRLPQHERLRYLAGQYIDVLLRDGRRRSFSIASAPHADGPLQLQVRHVDGGAFTDHVFHKMKERDLLRFQGPLGTFFLREDSARPIILVAGGTGFAPIKAILEEAFAKGVSRPMHLFWGTRARRDMYRHDLAESWGQTYPQFRYTPVLSEPRPEDAWTGRTGWVHEAVLDDYAELSDYEVYASGPPPMIEAARQRFAAHGLMEDRFFFDSFGFSHDS